MGPIGPLFESSRVTRLLDLLTEDGQALCAQCRAPGFQTYGPTHGVATYCVVSGPFYLIDQILRNLEMQPEQLRQKVWLAGTLKLGNLFQACGLIRG